MKHLLTISALLLVFSCTSNAPTKTDEVTRHIGKYLYVDAKDCLHTRLRCQAMRSEYGTYRVDFLDTLTIKANDFVWFCSQCVDNDGYEQIIEMTGRNEWEGVK